MTAVNGHGRYGDGVNDRVLAAGGVLWRNGTDGTVEVAGVYRPATDNWSLPKGKLDHGEHQLAGACREVREETGLRPIPQQFLTTASYKLSRPSGAVEKLVDYWSMRAVDPTSAFVPTEEVTKQEWIPLSDTSDVLSRPRDRQALAAFTATPLVTSTVILLRHAKAAPVPHGGDDTQRPLDSSGRRQAGDIAELVKLYLPQQIIAAAVTRCAQTVDPLAAKLGLRVELDPVFDAASHFTDAERAYERLRQLADGPTTVVCTQAPVIADTLAMLADTDDIRLTSVHTPVSGAWVLSFSRNRTVAIEQLSVR